LDAAGLRRRIEQSLLAEKELLLAPEFFTLLPQSIPSIGGVDIQLKRGESANELSRYRYEVVLRKGPAQALSLGQVPELHWDERTELEALRGQLEQERPARLRVRRVPNARLIAEVKAAQALEAGEELEAVRRHSATNPQALGVEPEDFHTLGQSLHYRVALTESASAEGYLDALFIDTTAVPEFSSVTLTDLYVPASAPGTWRPMPTIRPTSINSATCAVMRRSSCPSTWCLQPSCYWSRCR